MELNGQKINLPPLNMGFDILRNIMGQHEECKENFKKCKRQFKDSAKTFMEQVKKNNELFKNCHNGKKEEEPKVEPKVEEKSEKKVEEKVE